MNGAEPRTLLMSGNTEARLERITDFIVSIRDTTLDGDIRPYLSFSDEIAADEIVLAKICSKIESVLLMTNGEEQIDHEDLESLVTDFTRNLLLHCAVLFADEAVDADDRHLFSFADETSGEEVATN